MVDLRSEPGAVAIERDVVHVSGPEAVAYLQGQLSQDVEALGVGDAAWSLLLQPTGKVDAWLRVTRTADDAVAARRRRRPRRGRAGPADALQAADQGRPRARPLVGLGAPRPEHRAPRGGVARGAGPARGLARGARRRPARRCRRATGWARRGVGGDRLEALRIEAGVPANGAELTDATIPAEAGQWLIDASVSFTKGCYTGQELVARIDSRGGNVPRPAARPAGRRGAGRGGG